MVIMMEKKASEKKIEAIIKKLDEQGYAVHRSTGVDHTLLGVIGSTAKLDPRDLREYIINCLDILRGQRGDFISRKHLQTWPTGF